MKELIEAAIAEMRNNNLPHSSLRASIALYNAGFGKAALDWYFNCEETDFSVFDTDGDIDSQIAEIEQYNGSDGYKVSDGGDANTYHEFSSYICPAPNYFELEAKLNSL